MHSHDPSIGQPLRFAPFLAVTLLAALFVRPVDAVGQRFTEALPEPGMPSAEGFEKDRALFFAEPNFTPFRAADRPQAGYPLTYVR